MVDYKLSEDTGSVRVRKTSHRGHGQCYGPYAIHDLDNSFQTERNDYRNEKGIITDTEFKDDMTIFYHLGIRIKTVDIKKDKSIPEREKGYFITI